MRTRMISAASVLVLLCLPAPHGSPLEPPSRAAQPWAPLPEPAWELRSLHGLPGACEAEGAPGLRRKGRAPHAARRKDGRPNSLDLTFHLLREFLEMSREERLAQKALSNKLLLHHIGK
ncbi:corticoliberin-like [Carettochelys insculpta]|uniref:corticoliberin-like n=1 Tax=Carettochelys insculpta TaxID=44489 RepID=UPI003EBF6F7F